jgi:hypothetical protein
MGSVWWTRRRKTSMMGTSTAATVVRMQCKPHEAKLCCCIAETHADVKHFSCIAETHADVKHFS